MGPVPVTAVGNVRLAGPHSVFARCRVPAGCACLGGREVPSRGKRGLAALALYAVHVDLITEEGTDTGYRDGEEGGEHFPPSPEDAAGPGGPRGSGTWGSHSRPPGSEMARISAGATAAALRTGARTTSAERGGP